MDKYRIVEYNKNGRSIFKIKKLAKIQIKKFLFFSEIKEEWQDVSTQGYSEEELKYHRFYDMLPSFSTLEQAEEKILEFTGKVIIHNID